MKNLLVLFFLLVTVLFSCNKESTNSGSQCSIDFSNHCISFDVVGLQKLGNSSFVRVYNNKPGTIPTMVAEGGYQSIKDEEIGLKFGFLLTPNLTEYSPTNVRLELIPSIDLSHKPFKIKVVEYTPNVFFSGTFELEGYDAVTKKTYKIINGSIKYRFP
ncbi:MAG: hypothetical protein IPO62_17905 [Saprospiraceae bacterium]|nr:hypothetical protein [Saprospiraceae bacterium]